MQQEFHRHRGHFSRVSYFFQFVHEQGRGAQDPPYFFLFGGTRNVPKCVRGSGNVNGGFESVTEDF
jgi:hypothetical protein